MRILYITDGFPYPLTSGRLRHYYFIRELSARHAISLLATVPTRHPHQHAAALTPFVEVTETFETHDVGRGVIEKLLERLRSITARRPDRGMARLYARATELHAIQPFDVVLNAHLDCYIEDHLRDTPVVYDLCDALSLRARGELRHAPLVHWVPAAVKLVEAIVTERSVLRRAADVIVCAKRDADWLARRTRHAGGLLAIPNGVDTEYWRRATPALPPDRLVFAGVLGAPSNEDAALLLIRRILPLVRRHVPAVHLVLAGRDPSSRLRLAADREPLCELAADLADLRALMEQATVFVAPLRFSAGIQNKLLQAMAMSIPVVATPSAADGLITAAGPPPLAVGGSVEQVASAAIEALHRARRDPTPDYEARRFVERHFRWTPHGLRLEALLQQAAGAPRDAGPHPNGST